jgi:hypothetical protein
MTIAKLIKHLSQYPPEEVIAYDLWMVDDVKLFNDASDPEVTQEQAEEVIRRMEHRKDASIGMNWDVLHHYLDQVMEESKQGKAL